VPLVDRLSAAGHDVITPDLPYEDPSTTYEQRIQPALAALGDVATPVLVAHSLGAGYAPLLADRLPKSSVVYLCPAPVGPFSETGAPMGSTREGFEFPANRADGTSVWDPDVAIELIYRRLPADEARMVASCLKPGASPADPYPLATHPNVPTTFIYAAEDEFFEPEWSRWVARAMLGIEPLEVGTGHFPMIENPDLVARLLTSG
jgi:pimeloyl-ACP methyl ester carboxylesterase